MAGRVIDATLRFVDHFTRPMQQAMGRISTSSRAITRAGKDIKKVGKEISAVGAGLTKSVTVPVVAMGAAATKAGIDYESAFAGVRKTVDATEEEFAKLSKGIIEMSNRMPNTSVELAAIAESAGQLGIQKENILGFTEVMAKLDVATNLGWENGSSTLAEYANITKMSQKDFNRLGSTIVALGNNFATTESDIMSMAQRMAGAGAEIGLSDAEIMGFATALSSVGIRAEMGGSAISTAMKRMQLATTTGFTQMQDLTQKTGMSLRELELMSQNDTMGFKELAQSISMTKDEVNDIIKSGKRLEGFAEISGMTSKEFKNLFDSNPAEAMNAFITGLGNTEKAGKSTIEMLQEMGFTEIRLSDTLMRLAGNSEGTRKAVEMASEAWKKNTALDNEANERYKTTGSQLEVLRNNITNLGIDMSKFLIPPLIEITGKIGKAVTAFSELDDGTKSQIVKFAAMAAATGPLLSVFGKVTQGVGSATIAVGKFGDFIPKLKNRAGEAGTILKGITWPKISAPKGLKKIGSAFGGIGDMAKLTMSEVGGAAKRFNSFVWNTAPLRAVKKGLFNIGTTTVLQTGPLSKIGGAFGKLGKAGGKALGGLGKIGTAFGGVGKAMFTVLGPAGTVVVVLGAIVAAGILVYKNWDKIKKGAKALGKTVLDVFKKSGVDVDAFKKKATGLVTKVKNIVEQFKSAGKEVSPVFKAVLGFLSGTFVAGIKVGFGAVVGFASGFLKSAVDVADGVLTAIGGITKFISGVFTGNWKKAWEGVNEIFSGIFKTFVGIAKAPINGVIGLVNGAINRLNKIGIKFPKWVPGLGGKDFKINIPRIPMLYTGTTNWIGGPAMIHDRGAEIVDLPSGTRVYPHDKSLQMARAEGAKASGKATIIISKIADKIIVRNDEDIEKIANAVINKALKKICDTADNMGGIEIGDLA